MWEWKGKEKTRIEIKGKYFANDMFGLRKKSKWVDRKILVWFKENEVVKSRKRPFCP